MNTATCFTKIPNAYFDYWMNWLPDSPFKVLGVLLRKTAGWQKPKDAVAASQIAALTGLTVRRVREAINYLEAEGVIRRVSGRINVYSVHLDLKRLADKPESDTTFEMAENATGDIYMRVASVPHTVTPETGMVTLETAMVSPASLSVVSPASSTKESKETNTKETNTKETDLYDAFNLNAFTNPTIPAPTLKAPAYITQPIPAKPLAEGEPTPAPELMVRGTEAVPMIEAKAVDADHSYVKLLIESHIKNKSSRDELSTLLHSRSSFQRVAAEAVLARIPVTAPFVDSF